MRQRTQAAVLAAALAGAVLAPNAVAAAPVTELTGTYHLLSIDNAPGSRVHGREEHVLMTDDGRAVPLALAGRTGVKPGARVRVRGEKSGSTLQVSFMSTTTTESGDVAMSLSSNGSTGTTTVLAILASWSGPDTVTAASATDVLFGSGSSWWSEASYGALTHTGVVTPWVGIAKPASSPCTASGMNEIATKAENAALAVGYDAAQYERTLIYLPSGAVNAWADCYGVAGIAYVGGNLSLVYGYMTMGVTLHEQGHNYGLQHANTFKCSTGAASGTCTVPSGGEYGDPHDPMGHAEHSHVHAAHKNQLGWLGARGVALGPDSSVRLTPYAGSGSTPVAAYVTAGTRKYWFEYRQRINQDAGLHSGATGGVLVHLADADIAVDRFGLLDMTPDGNWDTAVLANGASWAAPEGFSITLSAGDTTGVTLTRTDTVVAKKATAVTSTTRSYGAVTYPTQSKLQARLMSGTTPLAGKSVSLYVRKRGYTGWSHVYSGVTSSTGWVAKYHSPLWHADYQWRFAGDPAYTASAGSIVSVYSRLRLTGVLDKTSMLRGSTAKLSGRVGPAHSGTKLYLQRYYSSRWNTVGYATLGTSTAYYFSLKIGTPGTYKLRTYIPTHSDHYYGVSPTLTLTVK